MSYNIPVVIGYILITLLYVVYLRYRKSSNIKKGTSVVLIILIVLFIISFFAWGMLRNIYLPDWAKD